MDRRISLTAAVLVLSLLTATAVLADGSDECTEWYPWCPVVDDFTTDTNVFDWSGVTTTVQHTAEKDFGVIFKSTADGVMQLKYFGQKPEESTVAGPTAYRWTTLPAGTYRVRTRLATDVPGWELWTNYTPEVLYSVDDGDITRLGWWDGSNSRSGYATYETSPFTLTTESRVKITLRVLDLGNSRSAWVDYVLVAQAQADYSDPGAPTPTPITPIPTATPLPAPHNLAYCVPAQTASSPIYGQPTPAPDQSRQWGILNDDGALNGEWLRAGGTVTDTQKVTRSSVNFFRLTALYATGSVAVGVSPDAGSPMADMTRIALVYQPSITFTVPFTVSWWATVDKLATGETAHSELWTLSGGSWTRVKEHQVNSLAAAQWVQGFAFISGSVDAMAWTFRGHSTGTGYLDDINVFGSPEYGIHCDGAWGYYPPIVSLATSDGTKPTYGDRDVGSLPDVILVPKSKACPPYTLTEPNNFWGPLIANLTIWLDKFTALWPGHAAAGTEQTLRELTSAPVWGYLSFLGMMVDLTPVINAALIVLALEGVRVLFSLWLLIKRAVPFLGG